ncbi:MBL fold metallo-hydrolase [Helicobacter aurati]|uniref:MBL fold metallo-hydrolase n=1 Tax=Helicobacter aurati TaxID=137778 RepID=A0A3D8J262_9HELI|nr:MBL fold metallo-hydrolase [Helicobacter aurati]RDU71235.1 MBL fold metallo-hydrolase [Helicobacter aurati]
MEIVKHPFGEYATNAYLLKFGDFEFVVDPGYGSTEWILSHSSNLQAILITHGHFDHIWDTALLHQKTHARIYCPKQDAFMLESDCFHLGLTPCKADTYIENNESTISLSIKGVDVHYWHFPGHTPGCSMIEIENCFFSGDFIFHNSIGRCDFPYSDVDSMKHSLRRFLKIDRDLEIYPGHGKNTMVKAEQQRIPAWIRYLDSELRS